MEQNILDIEENIINLNSQAVRKTVKFEKQLFKAPTHSGMAYINQDFTDTENIKEFILQSANLFDVNKISSKNYTSAGLTYYIVEDGGMVVNGKYN
jgi:hypothetical protein